MSMNLGVLPGSAMLEGPLTVFQEFGEELPPRNGDIATAANESQQQFKIRVAKTSGWRQLASSLIQRRFHWRGYKASPLEDASKRRLTLVASVLEATVGTITVGIDDSPEGLYVETLYPDEVKALRDAGCRLCEFTKLAVDGPEGSQAVLATIFHVAFLWVFHLHHCTDLLIEVNPRHVRFYQRMLGFKPASGVRLDPAVNAPAVLMRLKLAHCAAEIESGGKQSASDAPQRSLYPRCLSPEAADGIVRRLRAHLVSV